LKDDRLLRDCRLGNLGKEIVDIHGDVGADMRGSSGGCRMDDRVTSACEYQPRSTSRDHASKTSRVRVNGSNPPPQQG